MSDIESPPVNRISSAPEEVSGAVDLTNGYGRYIGEARRLLKTHTGSEERFLSAQEENDLAEAIQLGLAAEKTLAAGGSLQALEQSQLEEQITAGRSAKRKLVECNLLFAAYCARLSMNLNTTSGEADGSEAPTNQSHEPRSARRLPFKALRSPYAVLDDRVQVAGLALLAAADKFQPQHLADTAQLVSFRAYAVHYIWRDLVRYIRSVEQPGWNLGDQKLKQIRDVINHPERSTPNKQRRLALQEAGRHTVPLEAVTFPGDDDQPILTLPEVLSATEAADPTSDQAFANMRTELLLDMLNQLLEPEARSLLLRYVADLTLREVAQQLGSSVSMQRQRVDKGSRKLRHPLRRTLLDGLRINSPALSMSPRVVSDLRGATSVRTKRQSAEPASPSIIAP